MDIKRKSCILAAFFLVFVSRKAYCLQGDSDNSKKSPYDAAITHYYMLSPSSSGHERAFCQARGLAKTRRLCVQINANSKCEVTCKFRRPNCEGYGSLCYDPRFVGGDGVMFYFHGAKGGNFAIVSDDNLQINAHFIGTRPEGRTRDFTWVQALSIMFDTHTLVIAAKRVSKWDDNIDALTVKWDGQTVDDIPTDGDTEWRANGEEREVVVERTDDTNTVRVQVANLVELNVRVRPIGKEENRVHNYQLPENDAFAHLETQFKFLNLTDLVEGVLGKTYRPDYVSPVKIGVPMPTMGEKTSTRLPPSLLLFAMFAGFNNSLALQPHRSI
ncbi:unnamed protein product [Dovyalis caffra]|uniref:Uncharacterized protein n=1 Tax=Dovyalis caffra TaxID=77055 RepID=A0AAV1R131_9ROSI|nr:unnamed protein product [Dovyalis caffra]